jgi:hypothetical protein
MSNSFLKHVPQYRDWFFLQDAESLALTGRQLKIIGAIPMPWNLLFIEALRHHPASTSIQKR